MTISSGIKKCWCIPWGMSLFSSFSSAASLCCPLHFLQLFTQHVYEDSQCIQILSYALDGNFEHMSDTPMPPNGRRGYRSPLRTKQWDALFHITTAVQLRARENWAQHQCPGWMSMNFVHLQSNDSLLGWKSSLKVKDLLDLKIAFYKARRC